MVGVMLGSSFGWAAYIHAALLGKYVGDTRKHIRFIDWILKDDKYIVQRGYICFALRGLVWTGSIALSLAYFNLAFLWFAPVGLLLSATLFIASKLSKDHAWGLNEWFFGGVQAFAFALICGSL